jgi:hypothetical protein
MDSSPLLIRRSFAEFTFGFTVYRLTQGFLFFHDTLGATPEPLAMMPMIDSSKLESLFSGADARITSISLANLDLGRHASRRRVLDAYSVGELAPDLADQSHQATVATGRTASPVQGMPPINRYVGFSRGRVRDRSSPLTSFAEFRDWVDELGATLTAPPAAIELFQRYAEVVRPPADTTPLNVLLDFEQEIFEGDAGDGVETLAVDDLCLPIRDGRFTCVANGREYDVGIAWDAAKQRYNLSCDRLDSIYSAVRDDRRGVADTLIARLNLDQAFRIVTQAVGLEYTVYSSGHFLRPRTPLWGRRRSRRLELLELVDAVEQLEDANSEKGAPGSATPSGWVASSVFGLVDRPPARSALAAALRGVNLMVCDDMNTEIADFIAVDEATRRVIAIHCKASGTRSVLSASKLHEVTAQALKNLGFIQPYDVGYPPNVSQWDKQWTSDAGRVDSRYRRDAVGDAQACWRRIRDVLRDPGATREVFLVLGATLSRSLLAAQQTKDKPSAQAIQVFYAIQSTWSSVSSIGARLRVFCSP